VIGNVWIESSSTAYLMFKKHEGMTQLLQLQNIKMTSLTWFLPAHASGCRFHPGTSGDFALPGTAPLHPDDLPSQHDLAFHSLSILTSLQHCGRQPKLKIRRMKTKHPENFPLFGGQFDFYLCVKVFRDAWGIGKHAFVLVSGTLLMKLRSYTMMAYYCKQSA